MQLQPCESTGGTEGMPVLCQGPGVTPSMTRAPILPSSSQSAWTSYQGGAPFLPVLSLIGLWGGPRGKNSRPQCWGWGWGRGLQRLSLLQPAQGPAGHLPSECAQRSQRGLPCPSGSILPALCQLHSPTPGNHHRLGLVGKSSLTPRLEEQKMSPVQPRSPTLRKPWSRASSLQPRACLHSFHTTWSGRPSVDSKR